MKIFVVSLCAFLPSKSPSGEMMSIAFHVPAILPAESIEAAAEHAKQHALQRFQESEGYYGHQAAIMNVTKQFYDAADAARSAGILDMTEDAPQCFPFDSGLDAEFLS